MIRKSKGYYRIRIGHWFRRMIAGLLRPRSIVLYVMGIVLLVGLVLWESIRVRLYNPDYLIQKVVFSTGSIASYDDVALFDRIVHIYSGSYYSTARLGGDVSHMIDDVIKEMVYVDSIIPLGFSHNTLLVDVKFKNPAFKFRYKDQEYGIYTTTFIPLHPDDQLGQSSPLILLPLYLSGSSESISGVLYSVNVEKMLYDYLLLQTSPIQGSLTYIPGGEKYVIWNPNQRVYFNAKKNISQQLTTLYILKNNYNGFEDLKQIDVGSLANPIVK